MSRLALYIALSLPLVGCFSAELDPNLGAVFACDEDDDCQEGQICAGDLCLNEENIPFVRIVDPPMGGTIALPPMGQSVEIPLTLETNIELVPEDADADDNPLRGFLQAELVGGGAALPKLEQNPDPLVLTITLDPMDTPRSAKIVVRAKTEAGTPFPNPEAVARTVVFLDDGMTPQVAIAEPWPGESFGPLSQSAIQVTVTTTHFTMRGPQNPPQVVPDAGHVHIVQRAPDIEGDEVEFPAQCLQTRLDCSDQSNFYTALTPGPDEALTVFSQDITLNRTDAEIQNNRIWAILVRDDHTSVGFPADMPSVVVDEVPLDRDPRN